MYLGVPFIPCVCHLQKGSSTRKKGSSRELRTVMQPKISLFFKSSSASSTLPSPRVMDPSLVSSEKDDYLVASEKEEHISTNNCQHKTPESDGVLFDCRKSEDNRESRISMLKEPISEDISLKPQLAGSGLTLNKKRSYAQFHLDLGQSNFNLHKCSICGLLYAPGDECDEKNHKTYHKDYTHGIQFKGWRNERVIHMPGVEGGRIISVLECDSLAQRKKVQDVVKMMENELGDGWIFHKLCKVYLFISSQRVAGCLVAESVKEAFKIISRSGNKRNCGSVVKKTKQNSTTLQFGSIVFQREVTNKTPSANSLKELEENHNGAIVCETEAVDVVCGIRAIYVSPSNRRKGIASHLLEAVRRSFCMGYVLEKSQLAFSQPTSTGIALASNYFGTPSFLVYTTDQIGNKL